MIVRDVWAVRTRHVKRWMWTPQNLIMATTIRSNVLSQSFFNFESTIAIKHNQRRSLRKQIKINNKLKKKELIFKKHQQRVLNFNKYLTKLASKAKNEIKKLTYYELIELNIDYYLKYGSLPPTVMKEYGVRAINIRDVKARNLEISQLDRDIKINFNKYLNNLYNNSNIYTLLDDVIPSTTSNIVYCGVCSKDYCICVNEVFKPFENKRASRVSSFSLPCWVGELKEKVYTPITEYIISLKKKIRTVVRTMQCTRTNERIPLISSVVYTPCTQSVKLGDYQMDNVTGDNPSINTVQAGNVVLTEVVTPDISTPVLDLQKSIRTKCTTEQTESYSFMTDRWLIIKHGEWTSSTSVAEFSLPRYAVVNELEKACTIPTLIPFTIHRYWRGDMEVSIRLNPQKFQYGCLQVSWLYSTHLDANIKLRENIHSLSQTNSAIIQAGTGNSAILKIPFLYHKQYLHCKPMMQHGPALNLGKLYIKVLSPLQSLNTDNSNKGDTSCSYVISIKFSNNEFVGLLSGEIDKLQKDKLDDNEWDMCGDGQMMSALGVAGAMSLLNQFAPDSNRDNPSDVRPPQLVVPTASNSWCVGTNSSEPINPLRLNAAGQVPHFGMRSSSNMFSEIVRQKYLVTQIPWNTADHNGSALFKCPASPLWPLAKYAKNSGSEGHLTTYHIPPCGIISSMHTMWRGCLNLELEFVVNSFFTGKLLVAYIPGMYDEDATNITLDVLRSCPNVEMNIQEQLNWTFKIPFINGTPWCIRQLDQDALSDNVEAPGMVVVMVLNRLKCSMNASSGSKIIDINVYLSAADDFEVAVPCQPALGLGWNDVYVPPAHSEVSVKAGYYPMYAGIWRFFNNSKYVIMRYGPVSDHIVQLNASKHSRPYILKAEKTNGEWHLPAFLYQKQRKKADGSVEVIESRDLISYYVPWFSGGYCYLIPVPGPQSGMMLAELLKIQGDAALTDANLDKYALKFKETSEYTEATIQPTFSMQTEVVLDNQIQINTQTSTISSASNSTLGEQFNSVHDLTRRYQLYGAIPITYDSIDVDGKCIGAFPVLPQGLINPVYSSKQVIMLSNFCREGPIPILASAYRYCRGSIRLRIVGPSGNFNLWTQHRSDIRWSGSTFRPCTKVVSANGIMNHGYAYYIQSSNVNSISEIEVPFYKPGTFILLQQPPTNITLDDSQYVGLGEVYVGIQANKKSLNLTNDFDLVVFYANGDDMSYYGFQGFPPMVSIKEIGIPKVRLGKPQMFGLDSIFSALNPATRIREEIGIAAQDLRTAIEEGSVKCGENMKVHGMQFANNIISNLIHTAINPTASHWSITIASSLVSAGILTVDSIQQFISFIQPVVDTMCSWSSGNELPTTDTPKLGRAQSDDNVTWDDNDMSVGLGLFMTSICAIAGTSVNPPKDIKSFVSQLTEGISKHSRLSLNLIRLFSNCIETIKKLWRYVFGVKCPLLCEINNMHQNKQYIEQWCYEVLYLTGPDCASMLERSIYDNTDINTHRRLVDRVNDAYSFGSILLCESIKISSEIKTFNLIKDCYKRIVEVKEKLISLGKHPLLRQEPVLIWAYGASGVMKTTIMKTIMPKLINDCGIDHNHSSPYYPWTTTAKHQTGCGSQPAAFLNDYWAITTDEAIANQIEFIMTGKDSSPWSPPMAEITSKHLRFAPAFLFVTSNKHYIDSDCITSKEAFHRRIDVLYYQRLPLQYREFEGQGIDALLLKHPELAPKIDDYSLFEFYISKNPVNKSAGWIGPLNYENFYKLIFEKSKELRIKRYGIFKKTILETFSNTPRIDPNDPCEEGFNTKLRNMLFIDSSISKERAIRASEGLVGRLQRNIINSYVNFTNNYIKNSYLYQLMCGVKCELEPDVSVTIGATTFNNPITVPKPGKAYTNLRDEIRDIVALAKKTGDAQIYYPQMTSRLTWYDTLEHYDNYMLDLCFNNTLISEIIKSAKYLCIKDLEDTKIILCEIAEEIKDWSKERFSDLMSFSKFCVGFGFSFRFRQCKHCLYAKDNIYTTLRGSILDNKNNRIHGIQFGTDHFLSYEPCGQECVMRYPFIKMIYMNGILSATDIAFRKLDPTLTNIYEYFVYKDTVKSARDYFNDGFAELKSWSYWFGLQASSVCKAIWWGLTDVWKWILPILNITVSMIVATVGAYYVVNSVQPAIAGMMFGKKGGVGESVMSGDQTKVMRIGQRMSPTMITKQNGINDKTVHVFNAITNNFVYLCKSDGMREVTGRCLMLKNRECLVLRHYIEIFLHLPGEHVYLQLSKDVKRRFQIKLSECDIRWFGNAGDVHLSNYGILTLPANIMCFKNIIKHIASRDEHKRVGCDNHLVIDNLVHYANTEYNVSPYWVKEDMPVSEVRMSTCYEYEGLSKQGNCGSILVSSNLNNCIIGMHVAGSSDGKGCAEPLYKEMFEDVSEKTFDVYMPQFEPIDLDDPLINWDATVFPIGRVPKEYKQKQNGTTCIIPSNIHGVFPVKKQPAPLHAGDKRLPRHSDPLKDGCAKHGLQPMNISTSLIHAASDDLKNKIMSVVTPVRYNCTPLNDVEAICGLVDVIGFDSLKFNTSEGYPLSSMRPKGVSDKSWLFDLDVCENGYRCNEIKEPLKSHLYMQQQQRKKNIRPFTVFTDCLKDTTLDLEKCSIPGKTRVFSISPVAYTIEFRKYFTDFMAAYTLAGTKAEHGIGVACDGPQWGGFARYLSKHGSKIIAADYSNFGPGLHSELAEAACDIVLYWTRHHMKLDDATYNICKILMNELINSYHLKEDILYAVPCGIPSGSPITAILNSLVNCLYIRIAWMMIFENNLEYRSLSSMHELCNILVYGDDFCINIHDSISEQFNTMSMSLVFKKIGIKLTDIDKSNNIIPYRTLHNVTFLKREFKQHPFRPMDYLAPLDINSITDCANWIHKSSFDVKEGTRVNAVQCCDLAYGHGQTKHEEIVKIVRAAYGKKNKDHLSVKTWMELDMCYFNL